MTPAALVFTDSRSCSIFDLLHGSIVTVDGMHQLKPNPIERRYGQIIGGILGIGVEFALPVAENRHRCLVMVRPIGRAGASV